MSDEGGDDKKGGGGSGNPMGMIRTLAGLLRKKTDANLQHVGEALWECYLIKVTNVKIPPKYPFAKSIAYYGSFIHEILDGTRLVKYLKDLMRNGRNPDRMPIFLLWFAGELMIQKQKFSLINAGSMTHTAMAIGDFEQRDNKKHRITGELLFSDLAMAEMLEIEKQMNDIAEAEKKEKEQV